jgi:plasmid replication initiation protein
MRKKIIQTTDQEPLEVAIVNIDLTISKDKLVVTQSNSLAISVQQMTLQEKRLLLLAMSYVRQSDDGFMLYRIPITEIQKSLEIDDTTSYDRIREVSKKLLTRLVEIEKENGGWKAFQWLSYCEYVPKIESETGEACLEMRFHDYLRPFLLKLKKHFGSIRLLQLAAMPSFHSIRICEILFHSCKKFTKPEFDFSVDDLKKRLGLKNKYANFKDFRLRILKQAQKDCTEYSPLTFTWQEEKKGRKIVSLRFKVKKNPKFEDGALSLAKEPAPLPQNPEPSIFPNETATTLTVEQNDTLTLLKENGVNKTTAENLIKDFPRQQIIKNVELARQKHKTGKTKDLGGLTVAAIREDWSNQATIPSPLEQAANEERRQIQAANEHRAQKEKRVEDLKSAFYKERRQRVSEIMASWDEETLKAELANFEKTTNLVTRNRYRQSGLNSRLVKAAFDKYVAEKYLSAAENDFVIWASRQGYDLEGSESGGYRMQPVRNIGALLGDIMQKMEGISGLGK